MVWENLFTHPHYYTQVNGIIISVNNGVFTPDPQITYSSHQLALHIPDLHGKSFLDLGCGTGVLAVNAAVRGANRVLAVDISDAALENTLDNVILSKQESVIEIRKSNLFENINESFDYIFANLPILESAWESEAGLPLIQKFIDQSPNYLNCFGKAYFAWASFADIKPVREYCKQSNFIVEEHVLTYNKPYSWHVFELSQPKN